ncbi:MAG TPA: hypothetical protein VFX50_17615 [Gemmatimonadales bacterium]|nr:hypothetical protein [Gemmatimonadales bacterium]
MKSLVPWYARIGAKIVLARAPMPYALWRRVNLFKHGAMTDVAYARAVFERHLAVLPAPFRPGFTALELGPGDSLFSAVLARLAGAARTYLVDAGAFATDDVALYRDAACALVRDLPSPPISPTRWTSIGAMLEDCGGSYGTDGLASLRAVPEGSVHLSWSHAVLEHVRHAEFDATMAALRRAMHPQGASSHQVDLRDHLGGSLHNLRFSHARWESPLFRDSGFYTNRIRYTAMLASFTRAGFRVEQVTPERWPAVPLARAALDPEFRDLPDDELRVMAFHAVLRPA